VGTRSRETDVPEKNDNIVEELEEELSTLFNGLKVDLRTPKELSRYFRSEVMENAEVLYDDQ